MPLWLRGDPAARFHTAPRRGRRPDLRHRTGKASGHSPSAVIDFNAINAYIPVMASITVRDLDDDLKHRLRLRAAAHGRSMEEEVREILRWVVAEPPPPRNLVDAIRARVAPLGGVELELPSREAIPTPPPLSDESERG